MNLMMVAYLLGKAKDARQMYIKAQKLTLNAQTMPVIKRATSEYVFAIKQVQKITGYSEDKVKELVGDK